MKNLKNKLKSMFSKKAKLCHFCEGDQGQNDKSPLARKRNPGGFFGPKWYPQPQRKSR